MKYKLSIIVPAYNAEKLIESCLDSILSQTLDPIELIVVNDGSKDKTFQVLKDYKKKHNDKKIILIDKENGGPSSARNAGLNQATGEYVAFVDCDDYVEPVMYEKLINIADDNVLDVVLCNILNIYTDGREIPSVEKVPANRVLERAEILSLICPTLMREDIFGGPCNRIYKREFIEKYNIRMPNNIEYGEDAVFQMQVFDHLQKTWFDNHCYYHYIHRNGTQSSSKPGRFKNTLEPLYKIRKYYSYRWNISEREVSDYFVYCSIMDLFNTMADKKYQDKYHYWKYFIHSKYFYQAIKKTNIKREQYTIKIYIAYIILKIIICGKV